jgi:regulator of replication initiation timing
MENNYLEENDPMTEEYVGDLTVFETYALLEAQIKDLKNQQDSLRVQILSDMLENKVSKLDTALGKFSITKLASWEFPEYVEQAKENYKVLEEKAKNTGEATKTEKESLRFTSVKL